MWATFALLKCQSRLSLNDQTRHSLTLIEHHLWQGEGFANKAFAI
uniref:Uncharacterized protein n=1 Tax=Anguilla anguilla TaxID=7936 RepID=A0A0E9XLA9_ANGAN